MTGFVLVCLHLCVCMFDFWNLFKNFRFFSIVSFYFISKGASQTPFLFILTADLHKYSWIYYMISMYSNNTNDLL